MPPKNPSRLHRGTKGKATCLEKPTLTHEDGDTELNHEESVRQYQVELLWCIQQLEKVLAQSKPNEKTAQEAWKALQVLKNNNQPIIRKRQLMRQHFGDYRAKMLAEEKKLVKMAAKMKIQSSTTTTSTPPKATFLRKSAFLTSTSDNFKFNFEIPQENLDTASKTVSKEINLSSNSESLPDGNTKSILSENIDKKVTVDASNTEAKNADRLDRTNNFKFNFSNSDFKFNFSTEKSQEL